MGQDLGCATGRQMGLQAIGRSMELTDWFFPAVEPSYTSSHKLLTRFMTDGGTEVPAMLVLPPELADDASSPTESSRRRLGSSVVACVIFFHPNACDIGICLPEMRRIQRHVFCGRAAILAPEYPGYGLLEHFEPNVDGIDTVALATWRYAIDGLGFSPRQIVLWGRSIGSGPATTLAWTTAHASRARDRASGVVPPAASRPRSPRNGSSSCDDGSPAVAALVLVAPFVSVSAVVAAHVGENLAAFFEPMWEVKKLLESEDLSDCPLCVVHPEEDDLVPKAHSEEILEFAVARPKLGVWLKGEGHNFHCSKQHLAPVREFLSQSCPAFRGALVRKALGSGGEGECTPGITSAGDSTPPATPLAVLRDPSSRRGSLRSGSASAVSGALWREGLSASLMAWGTGDTNIRGGGADKFGGSASSTRAAFEGAGPSFPVPPPAGTTDSSTAASSNSAGGRSVTQTSI